MLATNWISQRRKITNVNLIIKCNSPKKGKFGVPLIYRISNHCPCVSLLTKADLIQNSVFIQLELFRPLYETDERAIPDPMLRSSIPDSISMNFR